MNIISDKDFKGVYKISTDNFSQLSNYIALFEKKYILSLLGASNYKAIDTLTAINDKYDALFNGYYYDGKYNEGFKLGLLGFIYFHYVSDNFTNTSVGNVVNANENSINLDRSANAQTAINRYNASIMLVNDSIIPFLDYYKEIKEPINGQSNVGTTYKLLVDSTLFLSIGDIVEIDKIEYKLTDVVQDTSISFIASSGVLFNGDIIYKPFYGINLDSMEAITI